MSKSTQEIKNAVFTRAEYVVIGICLVLVAGLIYFNISYSVDSGDAEIEFASHDSVLDSPQADTLYSESGLKVRPSNSDSLMTTIQADGTYSNSVSDEEHTAGEMININTADKQQLMSIKGIGEVKAEAIISYRCSTGKFRSVEELLQVRGIGEATLEKIKDFIVAE